MLRDESAYPNLTQALDKGLLNRPPVVGERVPGDYAEIPADRCQNCQKRPATMDWLGEGSVMDWAHGNYQRWCDLCAAEAQVEYAAKMAAALPDLVKKRDELRAAETAE
jgi:hypothetical protein